MPKHLRGSPAGKLVDPAPVPAIGQLLKRKRRLHVAATGILVLGFNPWNSHWCFFSVSLSSVVGIQFGAGDHGLCPIGCESIAPQNGSRIPVQLLPLHPQTQISVFIFIFVFVFIFASFEPSVLFSESRTETPASHDVYASRAPGPAHPRAH